MIFFKNAQWMLRAPTAPFVKVSNSIKSSMRKGILCYLAGETDEMAFRSISLHTFEVKPI